MLRKLQQFCSFFSFLFIIYLGKDFFFFFFFLKDGHSVITIYFTLTVVILEL